MSTAINPTRCAACGATIDEPPSTSPADRKRCPTCGSQARSFSLQVRETLTFRGKTGLKHKRPGYKKPILESVSGDDFCRATGQWNKLAREIDRKNNRYKEVIINPESGEVLRQCDEPLSEHVGRGSAKPKPMEDGQIPNRDEME